jgi:hypothetical protein
MFFMLLACSDVMDKLKSENLRGRLSTVDLFIKLACFVKKKMSVFSKAADLNWLVQGGQPY